MVTAHGQRWLVGGPFWSAAIDGAPAIDPPALLRCPGDRFMDELTALLARADAQRRADLTKLLVAEDGARLFQPGHGHYTLVLASLVCTLPGLPEHVVGLRDAVGFVVRRLAEQGRELAWVPSPGQLGGTWQPATADAALAGEELMPLFPVMWHDAGRTRRAWAGVVPVGARERYEGGATGAEDLPAAGGSPLLWQEELDARVFEPIADLRRATSDQALAEADAQRTSRMIVLELAELLEAHLGVGWLASEPPAGEARSLWRLLDTTKVPRASGAETSLRLVAVEVLARKAAALVGAWTGATYNLGLRSMDALRTDMRKHLEPLLASRRKQAADSLRPAPAGGSQYVVRCVYRRPPCGVRSTELVSARSRTFRMAGFLDLDAPQRPVRIALPEDVSLTSLRGLKKTVGIVMSAAMRGQTEAAANPDTLKGKVKAGPAPETGWITIWSIPILTICATILMMIIATILNIVFWWKPFLRITVPIKKG